MKLKVVRFVLFPICLLGAFVDSSNPGDLDNKSLVKQVLDGSMLRSLASVGAHTASGQKSRKDNASLEVKQDSRVLRNNKSSKSYKKSIQGKAGKKTSKSSKNGKYAKSSKSSKKKGSKSNKSATPAPVAVTPAPVEPTPAPVPLTTPPVQPTLAPVAPSPAPIAPTRAPTSLPTRGVTSAVIFVCSTDCGGVAAGVTQQDFLNALGPDGEATISGGNACGEVCNPGTGRRLQTADPGVNRLTILNLVSFTLTETEMVTLCQATLPGTSSLTAPPSFPPTETPTGEPTAPPSGSPSGSPSASPSDAPSASPSIAPSTAPTDSQYPSSSPSGAPSGSPSDVPSRSPTTAPTAAPTSVCDISGSASGSSSGSCPSRSPSVSPSSHTFEYTGSQQTFTVPSGVTSVTIKAWGARGGDGSNGYGGKGGYSTGDLSVNAGEILYIYVGGKGENNVYMQGNGGWNGGGGTNSRFTNILLGSGGGASDVRYKGSAYSNRIIVAGGGGGAGGCGSSCDINGVSHGGDGGGTNGVCGDVLAFDSGKGGTQSAGGDGGSFIGNSSGDGSLGDGGNGRGNNIYGGGGGGGGYYGGGGGLFDAGGGGSGYIGGVTSGSTIAGNALMPDPDGGTMTGRDCNGLIIISWYIPTSAPTASPSDAPSGSPTASPTPGGTSATIYVCSTDCGGVAAALFLQSDFLNALGPDGEVAIVGGNACGELCNPEPGRRRLQTTPTGASRARQLTINQLTTLNLISFTLTKQEMLTLCQSNLPGTSSLTAPV